MSATIDGEFAEPALSHGGFCLSHPAIQIRKRRRNGSWMNLLSACPLCQIRDDEEASLSARPARREASRADSHPRKSDQSDVSEGTHLSDLSASSPTMGSGRPGADRAGSDCRYTYPKHARRKCLQPAHPPPRPPPQPEHTTFIEPKRPAHGTATTTTTASEDTTRVRRERIPKCAAFDYSISDLEPSTRGHRGGERETYDEPESPAPPPPQSPPKCKSADTRGRRKLINLLDHHDGGCQSADWRGRHKTLSELDGAAHGKARQRAHAWEGEEHEEIGHEDDGSEMVRTASLSRLVHGRQARLDELKIRRLVPPSQRYVNESTGEVRAAEGAPPPPPPPPPPQRSVHSASTQRADNTRLSYPPPPRPPKTLYTSDASISVTSDLTGSTFVQPLPVTLDVSYDSFLRGGPVDAAAGLDPEPTQILPSIPDEESRSEGSEASEDLSLTSRWEEGSAVEVTEHRRPGGLRRRMRRVRSAGEIAGGSNNAIMDESNYTFATDGSKENERADVAISIEDLGGDECASDGSDEEASCCGSISLSSSSSEASSLAGDGPGVEAGAARAAGPTEEQERSLSSTQAQAPGGTYSSATRSCRDPPTGRHQRRHSQGSCPVPAVSPEGGPPLSRSSSCSPNLRGILRKAFGGERDGDGAGRPSPPRGILKPSSHRRASICSSSSTISSLDDNCSTSTASTAVFSYPSTDYSYSSSESSSSSASGGGHFPGGILRRGGSRCSGRSGSTSGGSRVCFAGRDHIILDKLVKFCERDDDHYTYSCEATST